MKRMRVTKLTSIRLSEPISEAKTEASQPKTKDLDSVFAFLSPMTGIDLELQRKILDAGTAALAKKSKD